MVENGKDFFKIFLLLASPNFPTGETGAGKSTLINLVVGCQILPTDIINGTKTICELRHSETERKAIFHYCDGRKSAMLVCRTEQEASRFLAELTNHVTMVDQQTEESPYEKIEIYWPLPILGVSHVTGKLDYSNPAKHSTT